MMNWKRFMVLALLVTTASAFAHAKEKKPKPKPGPYVFTSKASAQVIKALIVQDSLKDGYLLETDTPFQLKFSKKGELPFMGQLFMVPSGCSGVETKKVWSYTLVEMDGITTVTVQPYWEYPGDYCKIQTHDMIWNRQDQIDAFQAMLDKAGETQASK